MAAGWYVVLVDLAYLALKFDTSAFMVLCCALDMMLLWVSAIISLMLMVLSLGLRVLLEPFNDPVTPKVHSIFDLAIILDIFAVSRFYFEYDVAVGLFYQTP